MVLSEPRDTSPKNLTITPAPTALAYSWGFFCKVLYKNQKDVNLSYPYDLKNIAPCDAVYAHKGLRLQNDEVIVYREEQITLQYIIELKV